MFRFYFACDDRRSKNQSIAKVIGVDRQADCIDSSTEAKLCTVAAAAKSAGKSSHHIWLQLPLSAAKRPCTMAGYAQGTTGKHTSSTTTTEAPTAASFVLLRHSQNVSRRRRPSTDD